MSLDDMLPGMDTEIKIGLFRFTRREAVGRYQDLLGVMIRSYLGFTKSAKRAVDAGSHFPIQDYQMQGIEIAAILYQELPEEHELKKAYSEEQVVGLLTAARKAYYGDKPAPYLS